ncbi:MAG: hypothetical protein J7M39_13055 [Anaerolineae bacterium]|nr:hypothetical protein [Anaerolineae bacterium]
MSVLRFLLRASSVVVAALVGNWVGGKMRTSLTGEEVQSIRFRHTTAQGQTITNTPVVTKFYPAVVAARLGKPRWLYAFCGGVLAGALMGDRYERRLWDTIGAATAQAVASREGSPG